jgi:hypothetical protein
LKKIYFTPGPQNLLFVTFGSGGAWSAATKRLTKQARKFGKSDGLIIFDENDLQSLDPSLLSFAEFYPRGFGLWKWKPLIIQEVLRMHPGVKIVIYLDAGCELNRTKMSLRRFDDYLNIVDANGGLGFEIPHLEVDWTDPELFVQFKGAHKNNQLAGGILFLRNSSATKKLLQEWNYWMSTSEGKYLIGASVNEDFPKNYQEHRYDQSVISLLWHERNLPTLPDETFWAPQWKNKGHGYPIWATRNRLRVSYRHNRIVIIAFQILNKIKNR